MLVALVVLSLSLSALYQAAMGATRNVRVAAEYVDAVMLAEQVTCWDCCCAVIIAVTLYGASHANSKAIESPQMDNSAHTFGIVKLHTL